MKKKRIRVLLTLLALLMASAVVFWCSRPLDVDFAAVRSQVPLAEFSHFADVDGLRVHYQEAGTGPPLILVHGFTASTFAWKNVFARLTNRFRVIAVDLKGFGFTAKPAGEYTPAAEGDFLVRFLDHLKLDRATLCGHSLGGWVVLRAALQHPERVRALVLVDGIGLDLGPGQAPTPAVTHWPVIGPLIAALALTSDSIVRSGLRQVYSRDTLVTEELVTSVHRVLKTRAGLRATLAMTSDAELLEPQLDHIRCPALILWGAQDRLAPLAVGRRFNALIAGSRLVTFDPCGHAPQDEMPERFATEVSGFLEALPKQPVSDGSK